MVIVLMKKNHFVAVAAILSFLGGCNLSVVSSPGGKVISDDQKFTCDDECTVTYTNPVSRLVQLEAVPEQGYRFVRWGGVCADQEACAVPMHIAAGNKTVTAEFLPIDGEFPLFDVSQLEYQGGFRLSAARYGDNDMDTLSYSNAVITFNPANNSLFVTGHDRGSRIAEFEIPGIVDSRDMNDFEVGSTVIQAFSSFHNTDRVDTGIENYFRITGMALINEKLVVNYQNWYDASGQETDTSVVFQDANNLATSPINGAFQIDGAAHVSGWLTPIPSHFQSTLGGTHLGGYSNGSIISRLSVGPSAFAVSPENNLLSNDGEGTVAATALLDFNLQNMLYSKTVYGEPQPDHSFLLNNEDRQNDLWTRISGATYGFIVPGTGTYLTVGFSGGHESGVGYKIVQDDGNLCGGPCAYAADDVYNYFWAWKVEDLIKVKNGELEPSEVRPYDYGKLDTPISSRVNGAAFDEENGLLYLALRQGDTVERYARPPLFLVYKVN